MAIEASEISEIFSPALNEEYAGRFQCLVKRLGEVFPNYRDLLIKQEIIATEDSIPDNDFEGLRYIAALRVLYDLTQQGWGLEVQNNIELYLTMLTENSNNKDYIRNRLSTERKAQFKVKSTLRFIEHMERVKVYHGRKISIKNLIGSKEALIQAINNKQRVVDPYIQLVTHSIDEHTGYRDTDIWRYFRYTWSIPYKSMPGRNLFYLVRDRAQEFHPVIGIFALGNSVLNLKVRDNEIGWTVDAIRSALKRKASKEISTQEVSQTNGKTVTSKRIQNLETEKEHIARITAYSPQIMDVLLRNLKNAINDIYVQDLGYHRGTKYPSEKTINELKSLYEELRKQAIDNKKTARVTDWESETKEILFKKKRTFELAKLLDAMRWFNHFKCDSYTKWLDAMIKSEQGRKAINVALVANRKTKIGSNMMEIIVCGAIPPYNELLGGKLVSILACSPIVIRDYTEKYANQVSEIASRMKGKRVIRDSRLAFLGTTSLYSLGSSQYNRIKVPINDDFTLQFKKMGITEGYGTVYFSKETTDAMMHLLELQDGGRRINHVFGEGTSPRFRLISRGLSTIGIKADAFLKHYSPRIVYSMELASNTNEFLLGYTDELNYPFDITNDEDIRAKTQDMIEYWYKRWMSKRLQTVDIIQRLQDFTPESIILSYTR
ncbi:Druantia anti-phage system protein DruA [Desulfotomaculum sp. 1211_IL3151]|uniref:Druantia anti-phage system protein DruA n=1 Tax=Desulfotomaculum sp. 1211_IL3151 TaxID=3084055 RepID=UPI002FDA7EA0